MSPTPIRLEFHAAARTRLNFHRARRDSLVLVGGFASGPFASPRPARQTSSLPTWHSVCSGRAAAVRYLRLFQSLEQGCSVQVAAALRAQYEALRWMGTA